MAEQFYFWVLNTLFSPFLLLPPVLGEFLIALILVFIYTIFSRFLANQEEVKKLKEEQAALQKKSQELRKTNPEEANKLSTESLKLSNKMMKLNMKPMFATLLLAVVILPWLSYTFIGKSIVKLPFELPFIGNYLGWLKWYVLVSIPFSQLFRKLLGVQ
ncbi:MAG: TMCO1/EMC3 family protein [Candidatus Aenigmarchaeota archaeon]|nr:TMCO1/EMC3 family protein [Candidatus Aenigmarchaeota archaeon]